MTSTTAPTPFAFAGMPLASWSLAFRIWIAVVVALYAGFWLQLNSASSAAITVAILAFPTRGQALEKAGFRLIGTVIGVAASIVLVGTFSQTRDLLLVAFAAWIGLCVYAAGLWDGNRAYAAVLSGYTVALVAIQRIDSPASGLRLRCRARRRHCRRHRRHCPGERPAGRSRPTCRARGPAHRPSSPRARVCEGGRAARRRRCGGDGRTSARDRRVATPR